MPRLNGSRRTRAPRAAATSPVRSVEPSSTTTTSSPASNARSSSITRAIVASSFSAGTIATRRRSPSPRSASAPRVASATSGTGTHRDAEVEQLEKSPRTVRVGVLVEDALTGTATELLRLRRVGEQLPVGLGRLVRVLDDEELAPRLEPALDAR